MLTLGRRTHHRRYAPSALAPILVGVLPLAVPAVLIAVRHPRVAWADDRALTELAVRQAARGHQLLGIGGRFGWRHPGPAWIYLLLPLYELTGHAPWSLAVGAIAIHAVLIAAVVVATERSAGARAAAVVSASVAVYLTATGLAIWTNLWAGYAFTWPLLALIVVGAIGMADVRAGWALAAAAGLGTLLVQTDVSTAVPVVALSVVVATVRTARFGTRRLFAGPRAAHVKGDATSPRAAHARGTRRMRTIDPPAAALFVVAALAWVPPLVQQLANNPGNMTLLVRFARQGAGGHPLRLSLAAVGAALSIVPLGGRWVLSPTLGTHLGAGPWWAVGLTVTYIGASIAIAVVAFRRGRVWAGDLAVLTLVGLVSAVVAMSRVDGNINFYLLTWVSVLPVTAVTAAVMALAPEWRRRRDPIAVLALAVGAVAAAALVLGQGGTFDWDHTGSRDVSSATLIAASGLGRAAGVVRIHILTQDTWRTAAGVAVQLERRGDRIQVDPAWVFLFGDPYRPTSAREAGELWFARPHEIALMAGIPAVVDVGSVDGVEVFARPDT